MDFRLIETDTAPLLVYRDQDEESTPVVVMQIYQNDVILKQTLTLSNKSTQEVQEAIASLPIESANEMARHMASLMTNPGYVYKEDEENYPCR